MGVKYIEELCDLTLAVEIAIEEERKAHARWIAAIDDRRKAQERLAVLINAPQEHSIEK